MTPVVEDFDVESSAGLAAALEAVAAEPEVWESDVGRLVASEIVRRVPHKVGYRRVESLARTGEVSCDEVVADLAASVVEMLLMRRDLAAAGSDLWAVLARRAVWMVEGHQERARQHGLSGDSAHPQRMRERVRFEEADFFCLSRGVRFAAPGSVEVERRRVWVRKEDLGPVLGGVVDVLVWAGVPGWLARAGTCRVVELAASTTARERHCSAREDARDGVLGALGASPAAAGAWMSLAAGSRRGGLESALVWSLRLWGGALGDLSWPEVLSASQLRWVRTVAAGVWVQAPSAAPAGAHRPPVRLGDSGEQLALFPVEGVSAGAA